MNDTGGSKELFPLTHPQKRIWYIEKLNPDTSLHNLGGLSKVKGMVDFNLLEKTLNILVKKSDSLRMRFIEQNGEPMQYVSDYEEIKPEFFDFSKYEEPEKEVEKWANEEMRKPFRLDTGNLFYFGMYKVDDFNSGFLVKFHHIISDGWSIQVASECVCSIYMKLLNNEAINEEVEFSYLDYLENERKYLSSERFEKNRNYWMEKFKDFPEGFMDKNSGDIRGNRKVYRLDEVFSEKIKSFCTENKYSLNTFFVGLYLIYVYKITGYEDIIIGTPVLNRSGKKEKSIFGMFTSTMPFRFKVDGNTSVVRFLEKVTAEFMECFFNQKYPYDLLVKDIEMKKRGYDSLFQACVNYYNTKLHNNINGSPSECVELYNGNQFYSLQLIIKEWSDQGNISLSLDYKTGDYTEKQIESFYNCLMNLAVQVISGADKSVDMLEVLPEKERIWQLFEFNTAQAGYPGEKTIYQLFEEQVERAPHRIAVSFGDFEMTYSQLNKKANQLARTLRNKGVVRDTIVGLTVNHSVEAVIAILGILKAGGAYVPIDPAYPADRIEYMLEDSGSRILLTNSNETAGISFQVETINLNDRLLYEGEDTNLIPASGPNDLVYVIYTSGSTGKPKGVMIEHKGLVNYIWWARKMYVKSEDDTFALYSSLSFDLTVTSVFTPLIGGNKILVYRDDGHEYVLYRIMKENKSTVIKLTPSHLSLLKAMDNRNSSVKRFIVGGEDLKVSLAQSIDSGFGGKVEIFNEYGPTETVVGCMIHKFDMVTDTGTSVPIGIPADNVQIYILDKALKPLPIGCIGEMYISGDGVARGYINKVEITAERFIDNPFCEGKRMYKTGDLARFLDNGKIEYVGRADHQVKIHGYRIETGEIEKQIIKYEGIKDAVVIDLQKANGDKYLCGYIVSDGNADIHGLKNYLRQYLPEYMVPMHFVSVVEIPLTVNGKVDRSLLPEPQAEIIDTSQFIAPSNKMQEILLNAVCETLGLDDIGMKSNFFDYGGDSIKAIQIASKLNEIGMKISARDILSKPVFEEMAVCIEQGTNIADQSPCTGSFQPTPVYLWFLSQKFKDMNFYSQSVLLELKQDISADELGIIMNELVKHHDSLRLNLNLQTGELYYNENHLGVFNNVECYDLSLLPHKEQDEKLVEICEKTKSGMDIEKGILVKTCLFNLGDRGKRVLIAAHHFVTDGVSWRIILEDMGRIVHQIKAGKNILLPLKTHSLLDWSNALKNYSLSLDQNEKEYWNGCFMKDYELPVDYDRGEDYLTSKREIRFELNREDTYKLLYHSGKPYGTDAYGLMLSALALSAFDFSQSSEVLIELEGHGREELVRDIDISRTVGWFTSIYPALFRKKGADLSENIKAIKEQLNDIPNKGVGFGILRYISVMNYGYRKSIRFNYLGDFDGISENDCFKYLYDGSGSECSLNNHMTCLIDINAMVIDKTLKVSLAYSENKFREEKMKDFISSFNNYLTEIINLCSNSNSNEPGIDSFDMVKLSQDDLEDLFV